MSRSTLRLGRQGETLAAHYLEQQGFTIVERNARTPYGEIDLVAQKHSESLNLTVFVEVKTRRTNSLGPPEAALTARKKAHMLAAAQAYMQNHPELNGEWRLDVIAIRLAATAEKAEIVHFENALSDQ